MLFRLQSRRPRQKMGSLCMLCLLCYNFDTESRRKKWTVTYPNIPSAIRPVPHSEDLPVPVPQQQYVYILDSDEEPTGNREKTPQPSTSIDADFTADLQFNKLH